MKRYKYIFSFCLAALFGASLFTGCVKNDMIKSEEEKPLLTIVAGVSVTAGTRVDDPSADINNANGSWIENMTIFIFATDAVGTSVPLLVNTAKVEGSVSQTNQIKAVELTEKQLKDLSLIGKTVDIYAIANYIPANAAVLTKEQVMKLEGVLPEYKPVGYTQPLLPMSGVALKYIITDTFNQQKDITLQRAVIRVHITVIDDGYDKDKVNYGERSFIMNDVKFYNDYSKTYLWNDGIQHNSECRAEKDAVNISLGGVMDLPTYEFNPVYLNCNEPSVANLEPANKITVQVECELFSEVSMNNLKYTIELKNSIGTFHFKRNTALKVTITLKEKGYSTNVEVVPWNVDTETPDIDPVGIRFVDTDMPTVIPKDGKVDAKFNFDNPAGIPFKLYMFEGDTPYSMPLNTLDPTTSQQVVVTQLSENAGDYRSLSFWYQYNGAWVDTGVRAVQGDKADDTDIIQPKANTYLVAPSSKAILIPVAQANDAALSNITIGEVLTAELVWTDTKGATKGLDKDAAVAAIEVLGTGPDALLRVTPGSKSGNAVIAVKNTAGVIKWSWHIWVTNYDPELEIGQNRSGPYVFMDRNLGAKTTIPNVNGVDVAGNYYQFGRKDPFPTKGSATTPVTTYNAAGATVAQTTGATVSALNQIQNPYLYGNLTGFPTGSNLWGEGGGKTVNDPCPAGWRVPSKDAVVDFTDAFLPNDGAVNGRAGTKTGYYPYNWYMEHNGVIQGTKLITNWTSTSYDGTRSLMLRADAGTSVIGDYVYWRASGCAVRCVRDSGNEKAEKEVRVLTAGFISVSGANHLGTAPYYVKTWQEGLVPLLNNNFGPDKPVDAFFNHYYYYKGGNNQVGKDYDLIGPLTDNKIDVLYLPWNNVNGTPSAEQAKQIHDWLKADTRRVLFMCVDYKPALLQMQIELGITKTFASHNYDPAKLTALVDNDTYKAIVNGKYGNAATPNFVCTYDWTYFDRTELEGLGYVPILQRQNNANHIAMAINPTSRVVIFCDSAPFYAPSVLNSNGSLGTTSKGDYPILMANTWAWIVETVQKK